MTIFRCITYQILFSLGAFAFSENLPDFSQNKMYLGIQKRVNREVVA